MYPYLPPEHGPRIQRLLDSLGIDAGIERVAENPMGPESWQESFIHYALWLVNPTSRQGIPIYFSYDLRLLDPAYSVPAELRAEAQQPTLAFTFAHFAKSCADARLGFEAWCEVWGLPLTADAHFYFRNIELRSQEIERLLGPDGYAEFIGIGEMWHGA